MDFFMKLKQIKESTGVNDCARVQLKVHHARCEKDIRIDVAYEP